MKVVKEANPRLKVRKPPAVRGTKSATNPEANPRKKEKTNTIVKPDAENPPKDKQHHHHITPASNNDIRDSPPLTLVVLQGFFLLVRVSHR